MLTTDIQSNLCLKSTLLYSLIIIYLPSLVYVIWKVAMTKILSYQGRQRVFKSKGTKSALLLSTEDVPRVSPDARILQFDISRSPESTFS